MKPRFADRSTRSGIEVLSIDQIPAEQRHGRIRDQFTMWFGLNANIFPVVLGGVLVFMGLSLLWATIAIALGVVLGLLLVCFHAIQGPRLGVPQMIQSRGQFGFYGAVFVFAASIVLDFGFLAAQLVIQADAMNLFLPSVSIPAWIAIIAVPVLVLTIYGHDWLHAWQRWMTVILGLTFVVIFICALTRGGQAGAGTTGLPTVPTFMAGTSIFVIAMVSWAPYVSDYSRYLPASVSRARTFWAVFAGSAIPQIFCAVLGAYLTTLMPQADSTVAAIAEVTGRWVLPIMALSLIGSDVANAYTGMLALVGIVSCIRTIRRTVWLRVTGSVLLVAAGTTSALLGYREFVDNLAAFLNVLLYVFIPWSAINLTDYYLIRRGRYDVASFFRPDGEYPGFAWPGLVAYALAVLVQLPFIAQDFYTGPLVAPLGHVDISWIIGGIAGALFYVVAVNLWGHSSGRSNANAPTTLGRTG